MARLRDGSFRFLPEDIAARPWLGAGDDAMKVLHVDAQMGQVVFVQRFGNGSQHLRHTHHCTAVAFTLAGAWAYGDDRFPAGAVAFEPCGSTHQAIAPPGETAEVLVVLTAGAGNSRLLALQGPDGGEFELDLAAFQDLAAMRRPEEWAPFIAARVATGAPD